MRTRLVIGFAVAALAASTFACTTAPNPYAQVGEYCAGYAKAVCQVSSFCQFDPGACQTYQASQCNQQAEQAQASGTRQYNPANVQACLDQLNSTYAGQFISAASLASVDATCARVFLGTAIEGAVCTSTDDCAVEGDICATAPGIATETCAKPTQKQIGDDCADRGDECPVDSYCAPQTGTSVCVASQTLGQSCGSTVACVSADHCVAGVCQPLATMSGPCNSDADCVPGLFCDLDTDAVIATPICVSGYGFSLGSDDCVGIEGLSTHGTNGGGDAGVSGDAPSGD